MKSITALKSQHLRFFNCIVMLMGTATGVALVRNFEPKLLVMSLFAGATIAIVAYWFAGEPSNLSDEGGVGQRLNGN